MQSIARIKLSSITYAMQARELLGRHGISSNIIRLRPDEATNGCAYGLELSLREMHAASALLARAEIRYTII